MDQIYQLRQRLETPCSNYKENTYVNETYIYNTNAKSLNRSQETSSPIYSNTSVEQYRPNSQTSYANAISFGENLSHLRHSIVRNTNSQGKFWIDAILSFLSSVNTILFKTTFLSFYFFEVLVWLPFTHNDVR